MLEELTGNEHVMSDP